MPSMLSSEDWDDIEKSLRDRGDFDDNDIYNEKSKYFDTELADPSLSDDENNAKKIRFLGAEPARKDTSLQMGWGSKLSGSRFSDLADKLTSQMDNLDTSKLVGGLGATLENDKRVNDINLMAHQIPLPGDKGILSDEEINDLLSPHAPEITKPASLVPLAQKDLGLKGSVVPSRGLQASDIWKQPLAGFEAQNADAYREVGTAGAGIEALRNKALGQDLEAGPTAQWLLQRAQEGQLSADEVADNAPRHGLAGFVTTLLQGAGRLPLSVPTLLAKLAGATTPTGAALRMGEIGAVEGGLGAASQGQDMQGVGMGVLRGGTRESQNMMLYGMIGNITEAVPNKLKRAILTGLGNVVAGTAAGVAGGQDVGEAAAQSLPYAWMGTKEAFAGGDRFTPPEHPVITALRNSMSEEQFQGFVEEARKQAEAEGHSPDEAVDHLESLGIIGNPQAVAPPGQPQEDVAEQLKAATGTDSPGEALKQLGNLPDPFELPDLTKFQRGSQPERLHLAPVDFGEEEDPFKLDDTPFKDAPRLEDPFPETEIGPLTEPLSELLPEENPFGEVAPLPGGQPEGIAPLPYETEGGTNELALQNDTGTPLAAPQAASPSYAASLIQKIKNAAQTPINGADWLRAAWQRMSPLRPGETPEDRGRTPDMAPTINREEYTRQLTAALNQQNPEITQEQINDHMAWTDVLARAHQAANGGTLDDAYGAKLAGFRAGTPLEQQAAQNNVNLKHPTVDAAHKEWTKYYMGQGMDPASASEAAKTKVLSSPVAALTTPLSDGRSIIRAFKGVNLGQVVHETWHAFTNDLGWDDYQKIASDPDYGTLAPDKQSYVLTREGSEKLARAGEKYVATGMRPAGLSAAANDVLDKHSRWLTEIYNHVGASPLKDEIHPDVKTAFDNMMARSEKQSSYMRFGPKAPAFRAWAGPAADNVEEGPMLAAPEAEKPPEEEQKEEPSPVAALMDDTHFQTRPAQTIIEYLRNGGVVKANDLIGVSFTSKERALMSKAFRTDDNGFMSLKPAGYKPSLVIPDSQGNPITYKTPQDFIDRINTTQFTSQAHFNKFAGKYLDLNGDVAQLWGRDEWTQIYHALQDVPAYGAQIRMPNEPGPLPQHSAGSQFIRSVMERASDEIQGTNFGNPIATLQGRESALGGLGRSLVKGAGNVVNEARAIKQQILTSLQGAIFPGQEGTTWDRLLGGGGLNADQKLQFARALHDQTPPTDPLAKSAYESWLETSAKVRDITLKQAQDPDRAESTASWWQTGMAKFALRQEVTSQIKDSGKATTYWDKIRDATQAANEGMTREDADGYVRSWAEQLGLIKRERGTIPEEGSGWSATQVNADPNVLKHIKIPDEFLEPDINKVLMRMTSGMSNAIADRNNYGTFGALLKLARGADLGQEMNRNLDLLENSASGKSSDSGTPSLTPDDLAKVRQGYTSLALTGKAPLSKVIGIHFNIGLQRGWGHLVDGIRAALGGEGTDLGTAMSGFTRNPESNPDSIWRPIVNLARAFHPFNWVATFDRLSGANAGTGEIMDKATGAARALASRGGLDLPGAAVNNLRNLGEAGPNETPAETVVRLGGPEVMKEATDRDFVHLTDLMKYSTDTQELIAQAMKYATGDRDTSSNFGDMPSQLAQTSLQMTQETGMPLENYMQPKLWSQNDLARILSRFRRFGLQDTLFTWNSIGNDLETAARLRDEKPGAAELLRWRAAKKAGEFLTMGPIAGTFIDALWNAATDNWDNSIAHRAINLATDDTKDKFRDGCGLYLKALATNGIGVLLTNVLSTAMDPMSRFNPMESAAGFDASRAKGAADLITNVYKSGVKVKEGEPFWPQARDVGRNLYTAARSFVPGLKYGEGISDLAFGAKPVDLIDADSSILDARKKLEDSVRRGNRADFIIGTHRYTQALQRGIAQKMGDGDQQKAESYGNTLDKVDSYFDKLYDQLEAPTDIAKQLRAGR